MRTAIIGLGNIGVRLAKNLVSGGQSIIVADKTKDKADELAAKLGPQASALSLEDALARADVLILAISFDAIKQLLATHAAALAGKLVVDPSNPIAPDGKGGFRKIIPDEQSSGALLAGLIPADAKLVKAFGTLLAGSLEAAAHRKPERAVLFYASDDVEAGNTVARLIDASGFDPLRVGGIETSVRIEVFGDLHEAGKLGRVVSLAEAKSLV